MPEIEYTYKGDDIELLFKKEEELIERIEPFCLEIKSDIKIEYCASTTSSSFILKIIITHEE